MNAIDEWLDGFERIVKRDGFEDIPEQAKPCLSQDHTPPSHLYIPQGKQYRHICSGCGRETVLRPPQVTF